MNRPDAPPVRRATTADARVIAQLLHDFNREFDEPTPPVVELEPRIAQLLQGGDTVVLLVVVPNHVVHPGLSGGWGVSKPPAPEEAPDEVAR